MTVGDPGLGTKVGTAHESTIDVSHSEAGSPIPPGLSAAIPKALKSVEKTLGVSDCYLVSLWISDHH